MLKIMQRITSIPRCEARLHAIESIEGQILLVADPYGKVLKEHPRWMSFVGQSSQQMVGHGWLDAVHPDDDADTERLLRHALKNETPFEIAHRLQRRDASYRRMILRGAPVRDECHRLVEWVMVFSDVDLSSVEACATLPPLPNAESVDGQHLRLALQHSCTGTWEWDLKSGILRWDERCKRVFGLSPDAEVSYEKTFIEGIHPDDRDRVSAAIEKSLDPSSGVYDIEYRVIGREDNVLRWCHVIGRCIFEGSRPLRTVGIIQDVTARKQSESERDAALLRLGVHVDNTPLAVIEWDRYFRVVSWSRGAERMFGWSKDEVLGKRPNDWDYAEASNTGVIGAGFFEVMKASVTPCTLRNRTVKKDGSFVDCDWYNSGVYDDDAQVVSVLSLVLDVTHRVRAEADREIELAHAEAERERFQRLLLDAPVMVIFMRGPDHIVRFVNEAYTAFVPGGRGFVGKSYRAVAPHRASHEFLARIDGVYARGESEVGREVRIELLREGVFVEHFIDFTYQPIRRPDGSIEGVAGFIFDVTQSVQTQQALKVLAHREERARKEAEDANRVKEDFLSTLSHELRTPLNAIIGWASILQSRKLTEREQVSAIATIDRNARIQSRLIEDLLDISRITQNKIIFTACAIDLSCVIEAALEVVRPTANAKRIVLDSSLEPQAIVIGDADRLQQIVWNLLSNAIKFTPPQGRVRVQMRRVPPFIEISVTDNGLGIQTSFLPHVFDRFQQANGTITRKFGGLGLGLSIVRSLTELHDGTVTAMSDGLERGSTFTVRLPIPTFSKDVELATVAPLCLQPTHEPLSGLPSLSGLRILSVDDDPDARALIEFILRKQDIHVTSAESASQALSVFQSEHFDILLSDVGMPFEDGLSLLRKIRHLPPDAGGRVPALAITAHVRDEERSAVFSAGFNTHVPKPVNPNELLKVIAKLVDVHA